MIKNILVPVFLLFSLVTLAQQATSSPYSFYGIGDVRFRGTVENRLMGGVSVFSDSIHMNLQNPASYAGLKLSTFAMGASFNAVHLNSNEGTDKAQRTTVDYLAVGLPFFKKGSVAFGLIPYSSVGYKVRSIDNVGTDKRYEGNGGINRVFAGYGYQLTKKWSVGADISYNFGNIETTNLKYINGVQLGTEELNTSALSGMSAKIGAMYHSKFRKYDVFGSLSYLPQTNLKSENVRTIGTVSYVEQGIPLIGDQFDPENTKTTVRLPSQVSLGVGIGQVKKWLVGAGVVFKQSNSLTNRFNDVTQAQFENGMEYNFGGYYVPNYNSFSNYFKKITYRAGVRYEKTGMVIRNQSINDYALTGGFGLPLGGLFSNLNLGVEYGRRGTTSANLVQENYTNVIMSFSLNDKWFVQRKFD